MEVKEEIKLDLIPQSEPALSTRSDLPVIETKPDSQPESKPAPKEEAKPEAKAEDAAPDEGKTPEESAPPEEPEDPAANAGDEGKPKSKGVQKRIDELVRQREEAERRAEAEKAEKLRLLALVEQGAKPDAPDESADTDPEPQRPARDAYESTEAYAEALADYAEAKAAWSSRKAVQEALAEETQKRERAAAEEASNAAKAAYNARVEKAAEKYPDYKQVAESETVQVSIPMAHAILQSEHGPEIQYYLGKNPAEAKRISSLSPVQQLVEMGLIVGKLTAPAAAAPAPEPKPRPVVSAAPKPIKPLASGGEPAAKTPQEESMEEYAARRTKELAAERRSGARR